MRTMAELCDILEMDVNVLRDDVAAGTGDTRARIKARISQLDDSQVELLLSLADAMIVGRPRLPPPAK